MLKATISDSHVPDLASGPDGKPEPVGGQNGENGSPLTIEQAISLARYAVDESSLADIVRRLPEELQEEGHPQARNVAPLADNPDVEAILASKNWGQVFHLFNQAATEGVAARLLDWVANFKGLRDFNQRGADLARRFPGALTPERTRRLAQACLGAVAADLKPGLLVPLLLEKNAFDSTEILKLYQSSFTDTNKSARILITHEHATPELWMEVAKEYASFSSASTSQALTLRQVEDLRSLMGHAPAMATPSVVNVLLHRWDVAEIFGGMPRYILYLSRKLPPGFLLEQAPAVIEDIFNHDPLTALDIVRQLPSAWRRLVSRERIIELAATHPDSRVRQAAFLLSVPVGEETRAAQKEARGRSPATAS